MSIYIVLIIVLWITWFVYWQISAIKAKKTVGNNLLRQGAGIRILIAVIVLFFIRVPLLHHFVLSIHTKAFYENHVINALGVIIAFFGFALAIWARVYLGRNWGMPMTLKEKPELVTTGPYKYIRHPIYTGMITAMIGTTLVTTIFWIIPLIFLSAYFIYSSTVEEKNMEKQFPKVYGDYKKETKALIPFIY